VLDLTKNTAALTIHTLDAPWRFVNKPAGLPVFPPHADPGGDCVLRRLEAQACPGPGPWPPGFEGGLAHRLDTATSGLVAFAPDPEALARLRAQFQSGVLRKHYVFVSEGQVDFDTHVVEVELAHHPHHPDRMIARRRPTTDHRGKWYPTWTRFERLGPGRWAAEIRTGVMHQVRAHARFVGLPLRGDPLYGGAPGPFCLHHTFIEGPDWRSPQVPPPWTDSTGADALA
jgi:23S rRNA pseudouridine1911/1915/1917 synthase